MTAPADDGRRGTRDDLHVTDNGRFRFTVFPVRWDAEGETIAIAASREDTESGELDFKILGQPGEPMTGCACADCAPHEQVGPVPPEWWYVHTLPRCVATTQKGAQCRNLVQDEHPTGMCFQHRKRRCA